jgi:hypothetical protein
MMRFVMVSILIALSSATHAAADPIAARQILGGQMITDTSTGEFSVFGSGFNLQGRVGVALLGCGPCDPISHSALSLNEVRDLAGTVDGVTYPRLFVAGSDGIPSELSVNGGFPLPPDAVTGTQISFPFTTLPNDQFADRFAGYLTPSTGTTTPAFNFPVFGSGTAVITLHLDGRQPDGTPFYSPTRIVWTFSGSPSPTPEPASLALFGTGLAALVVRCLRRARA